MNRIVADIFSFLVAIIHMLAAISLVFVFGYLNNAEISTDSKMAMVGYTIGAIFGYIIIMGLVSVVLAIHENISAMREILEKNNK
jgi:undecaprenyl pyrophosphate phosphatase UppP